MITKRSDNVSVETVRLDEEDFRIFHLRLFAGTEREVTVPVAEYALEKKISDMIEEECYGECIDIDHKYNYYLPEEIDTDNDREMIESIEDVYDEPMVNTVNGKKQQPL